MAQINLKKLVEKVHYGSFTQSQRLKTVGDAGAQDRQRGQGQRQELVLNTNLGLLVKDIIMKFLEESILVSFLDFFLEPFLEDELLKMPPFQRHERSNQSTSSKVSLASGNHNDSLIQMLNAPRNPLMDVIIWARHALSEARLLRKQISEPYSLLARCLGPVPMFMHLVPSFHSGNFSVPSPNWLLLINDILLPPWVTRLKPLMPSPKHSTTFTL